MVVSTTTTRTPPAGPAPRREAPAGVLASLALCTLLPSLAVSSANAALPTLAAAFGVTFRQVQWVVLAYLLATTAWVVLMGRVGDVFGRRRSLAAGIALFTLASGLCGLAVSLPWLVAARVLQGLGAAAMTVLALAFVGDVVPKARMGGAMGLLGTLSAVGTALGPALGGALAGRFSWQAVFFANLPLGAAAVVLVWRRLPADAALKARSTLGLRKRLDARGMVLLVAALVAYACAMTWGSEGFGRVNLWLFLVAASGAALFVRAEARAEHPLVRLEGFFANGLAAGLATNLLVSSVVMATLVVGPFYLSRGLGLDAAMVGLAMCAGPAVSALAGIPAGRMVDRFGPRWMATAGLAGMALGCLALCALAPRMAGPSAYAACIAFTTLHYALFQAANNTAVMAGAEADRRGAVSGWLSLSRNLGLVTGASALGAVFAAAVPAADAAAAAGPRAVAAGAGVTFGVAAALMGLALALARWGRTRTVRR